MINDNNETKKYFITVRSKNHDILPLVATFINPGESLNKVAKEMRKQACRAACFRGQDINPASLQWGVYVLDFDADCNESFKLILSSDNFTGIHEITK